MHCQSYGNGAYVVSIVACASGRECVHMIFDARVGLIVQARETAPGEARTRFEVLSPVLESWYGKGARARLQ